MCSPLVQDNNMEIPDDLRELMNLDKAEDRINVANMFVQPEHKGEVIDFANLAEELMDEFLGDQATKGQSSAVLKKKPFFADKIKATQATLIAIDPTNEEHTQHIEFSECIRDIRNTDAHNAGIASSEVLRLADIPLVIELASDFPASGWTRIGSLRKHLQSYQKD